MMAPLPAIKAGNSACTGLFDAPAGPTVAAETSEPRGPKTDSKWPIVPDPYTILAVRPPEHSEKPEIRVNRAAQGAVSRAGYPASRHHLVQTAENT